MTPQPLLFSISRKRATSGKERHAGPKAVHNAGETVALLQFVATETIGEKRLNTGHPGGAAGEEHGIDLGRSQA